MQTEVMEQAGVLRKLTALEPFIGHTPLFPIQSFDLPDRVKLFAKLEWQQFGNSVKTRPAYFIFRQAIRSGMLKEGMHLLDASSGNTGVAYGAIGAALGIPVTLCLPENASGPKKAALEYFGVNIIYTSRFEGTDGSQEAAAELIAKFPDKYYYADQYSNQANWQSHYEGTAVEILTQSQHLITHFVCGLGTTGTFTGTGRGLKAKKNDISLISLQPDTPMHGLEGWKHMETAKNPEIYDKRLADIEMTVTTESAYEMIQSAAQREGILLSPSSAANLVGALKVARSLKEGVVVTVFPDHASNYPEVLTQILKR